MEARVSNGLAGWLPSSQWNKILAPLSLCRRTESPFERAMQKCVCVCVCAFIVKTDFAGKVRARVPKKDNLMVAHACNTFHLLSIHPLVGLGLHSCLRDSVLIFWVNIHQQKPTRGLLLLLLLYCYWSFTNFPCNNIENLLENKSAKRNTSILHLHSNCANH